METFAKPLFLTVTWVLFLIWSALIPILKLKTDTLRFLYWDFVFAVLLTLTFLTSLSYLAVSLEYKYIWFLIFPIIYGLFDLAENTALTVNFPEKTAVARFFTTGKWIFYSLSSLLLIILLTLFVINRSYAVEQIFDKTEE